MDKSVFAASGFDAAERQSRAGRGARTSARTGAGSKCGEMETAPAGRWYGRDSRSVREVSRATILPLCRRLPALERTAVGHLIGARPDVPGARGSDSFAGAGPAPAPFKHPSTSADFPVPLPVRLFVVCRGIRASSCALSLRCHRGHVLPAPTVLVTCLIARTVPSR